MSELDDSLRELRDDLRSSLCRRGLSDVAARARQRSVRRRMQVGAVAAVVMVSVAVPMLRAMPDDRSPAAPPADRYEYELDFADPSHGYALGRDCVETCRFTLLATSDGGRSWQPRPLPPEEGAATDAGVTVAGPERLSFNRSSAAATSTGEFFVSDDGGRTWHPPLTAAPTLLKPIEDGALVVQACVGARGDTCVRGLGSLTPQGISMPAVTQPPLADPVPGGAATASGVVWATGRHVGTGQWAVSVTSDGSRTWSTTPLDLPGKPALAGGWSVVEGAGLLYLTVVGSIGVGPTGLLAIYRSRDRGRTWTGTWRATPTSVRQGVLGSAVATSDGRLLLYSTLDGTVEAGTFTRAEHQLPGPVTWTRGGYLSRASAGSFELSADGVHWRTTRIG
jgi:hypothetical protein